MEFIVGIPIKNNTTASPNDTNINEKYIDISRAMYNSNATITPFNTTGANAA
jgi:hypothetical protein